MKLWYTKLCKKYKWFDWIDDNIIYYIWDRPHNIYRQIRGWFYYNGNKAKLRLIKNSILSYPYDGEYIDDIIYHKICEINHYFSKRPGYCSDEKIDNIIFWSGIAMNLGYIITHQDELWDYSGNLHDNTYKAYPTIYVNIKNKDRYAYRWVDDINHKTGYSTQMYDTDPWELYIAKARKLFYKIVYERGLEWWD